MKHLITLLAIALLMAGAADAKTPKRQTKKKRQTTTVVTTPKRRPATPITPPREINEDMLKTAERNGVWYVRDNYKKALEGYCDGIQTMARCWDLGDFGYKDEAEGLRWQYLAAQIGNTKSMEKVGEAYEYPDIYGGNSVEQNYFEAAKWYAKAAAEGNEHAANSLARLVEYDNITAAELKMVNEMAGMDMDEDDAAWRMQVMDNERNMWGTWRRTSDGLVVTIESGPYMTAKGVKFRGSYTGDGGATFNFYPYENYSITIYYNNGQLRDSDGRTYVKVR